MTKTAISTTSSSSTQANRLAPPSLNLIGAGKLGQTLARLWSDNGYFHIAQVMTQHRDTAQTACEFIGSGQAVWQAEDLLPADVYLIATPDLTIETALTQLLELDVLTAPKSESTTQTPAIVFHCSGALSSNLLEKAANVGLATASIHPIHSFASPANSLSQFKGSTCTYEGHEKALSVLLPAFASLGATLLPVQGENKSLYHAGSVIACNYLVALIEASLECFAAAGINRHDAAALLEPLMTNTMSNVLGDHRGASSSGPCLTGPIARGESAIVAEQVIELDKHLPQYAPLYRELGKVAVSIARAQNSASSEALEKIQQLLQSPPSGRLP